MKVGLQKLTIFLVGLLLPTPLAIAAPPGREKGREIRAIDYAGGRSVQIAVDLFIGPDRDAIRQHYANLAGSLPPGLAKRQGMLPPGLEKQLQRKGHLPPGLQKRLAPFPADLEERLAPLRPGLIRGTIGGRAVIVDGKTSVILDVLIVP